MKLYTSKGKLNWLTLCRRWDYRVTPARPPHYSLYTLLSLGDTFIALYVILGLHILALALVKWATVPSFLQFNAFNNFVHILENVNLPSPHQVQITQNRELIIHLVTFQ